jgi:hypothetical protein
MIRFPVFTDRYDGWGIDYPLRLPGTYTSVLAWGVSL